MSIAKMLEYQKVDRELYTLQKDFYALQKNEKFIVLQNTYKEKKNILPKLDKDFDDIILQLNDLIKKVENLESEKEDFENDFENFIQEDFEHYEQILQSFEDELNFISRDASKLNKKMTDISFENKKVLEQIDNIQKQLAQFKQAMLTKQKEVMIKAKPITDELQKIAKDIDPEMLKKYAHCRNNRFPVFMPYTEEGNCSACGMFVKIEVDKHLIKAGDYTECPNCRRILYKN